MSDPVRNPVDINLFAAISFNKIKIPPSFLLYLQEKTSHRILSHYGFTDKNRAPKEEILFEITLWNSIDKPRRKNGMTKYKFFPTVLRIGKSLPIGPIIWDIFPRHPLKTSQENRPNFSNFLPFVPFGTYGTVIMR